MNLYLSADYDEKRRTEVYAALNLKQNLRLMYCTIEVVIDTKHARPLCDSRATCHSSYAINDSVCRFGKKLSVSFL